MHRRLSTGQLTCVQRAHLCRSAIVRSLCFATAGDSSALRRENKRLAVRCGWRHVVVGRRSFHAFAHQCEGNALYPFQDNGPGCRPKAVLARSVVGNRRDSFAVEEVENWRSLKETLLRQRVLWTESTETAGNGAHLSEALQLKSVAGGQATQRTECAEKPLMTNGVLADAVDSDGVDVGIVVCSLYKRSYWMHGIPQLVREGKQAQPAMTDRVSAKQGASLEEDSSMNGRACWLVSTNTAETVDSDLLRSKIEAAARKRRSAGWGVYEEEVLPGAQTTDVLTSPALELALGMAGADECGVSEREASAESTAPEGKMRSRLAQQQEDTVGAPAFCYRLVNGSGDSLGGMIVDRFGAETCAVYLLTEGMQKLSACLVEAVQRVTDCSQLLLWPGPEAEKMEGPLLFGDERKTAWINEGNDCCFAVDIRRKFHPGWHYSRREVRRLVQRLCKDGDHVLDVFAGYGGCGIAAVKEGGAAFALCVEEDAALVMRGRESASRTGVAAKVRFEEGDGLAWMRRQMEEQKRRWDIVILDLPMLPERRQGMAALASFATTLLSAAAQLVKPNGFLVFVVGGRGWEFRELKALLQKAIGCRLS